jgi:hypothetical protein
VARLQIESAAGDFQGEQSLRAAGDCGRLIQGLAFALALIIDPHALDLPLSEATAATKAPVSSRIAPEITAEPMPPPSWRALAGLVGTLGAAPTPGLGVQAGTEVLSAHWALELTGRFDPFTSSDDGPTSWSTSLLVLTLSPCYRWTVLGICASIGGGIQLARAEVQTDPHLATDPYLAAGIRLFAEAPVSKAVWVRLSAEAAVPAWSRRFEVQSGEGPLLLWTTPPIQGALALDVLVGLR